MIYTILSNRRIFRRIDLNLNIQTFYWRILFVGILFFLSSSVFAADLLLSNGDGFILDLISEDERAITVSWKNRVYAIPRSEVLKIDISRKGPHTSYRTSYFVLKDSTSIRGVLAEEKETFYTVKTDLGYLDIDKSRIKNSKIPQDQDAKLPLEFLSEKITQPETKWGGSISTYAGIGSIANSAPVWLSGSFFIEPAYFRLGERNQLGIRVDALGSTGGANTRYSALMPEIYLFRGFGFSEERNFYLSIGIGPAAVQSKSRNETQSGIVPGAHLEIGYQGWKWESGFLRIGGKILCFADASSPFCTAGLEFSFGARL
ncbi:LA_3334 family protein [Leptospira wolffii]|uniref:LA_3334 family protein n=1 Tax=Leptospira wolffii TaxID=409998 RepID=UPI003CD0DAB6